MTNPIENKTVLITGGTGSIGRELAKQILDLNPKQVRIFSRDQSKQLFLQNELKNNERLRFLIGDVRDKERLDMATKGVDVVIHAAALKHVVSCEYNPFEAVKTNVLGLQNVLDSAIQQKVEKLVYISTDKAANPINIMGSTKALGEKLVSNAYYYQGSHHTTFSSVRFGNVLNSEGSVIQIFKNQIAKGGPLTITDPEMKRFFMSIPQAAKLVIDALTHAQVNEIFVLKMPVMKISDLAEAMIDELAPKHGLNKGDIKIEITGKGNGEKLNEQLMTQDEFENSLETEDFFIVRPSLLIPYKKGHIPPYQLPSELSQTKSGQDLTDTSKSTSLSKEEIKAILRESEII